MVPYPEPIASTPPGGTHCLAPRPSPSTPMRVPGGIQCLAGTAVAGLAPAREGQASVATIWGRSTVVRMPGAAAHTTGTALTARWAV